jgi:ribosome maturation factor RimP
MISKTKVLELIEERFAELDNGLFLVDLTISKSNAINIEIDKHVGGVSVKDCMAVSRNVEHNLDREEQDFELHVSSAGIDRPLRVLAQYIKNVGRTVELLMNDGTVKEGLLKSASETELEIETSRIQKIEGTKKKETIVEQTVIPLDSIKETKIVITF